MRLGEMRNLAVLAIVLVGTACNKSDSGGSTSKEPARGAGDKSANPANPLSETDSQVKPVYPKEFGEPDPRARKLCDALQTEAGTRRAKCCNATVSGDPASECVRMLTTALRDKAVTVEDKDVDACVAATAKDLEGCDWVTPFAPPPSPACRGIFHGTLASGAKCRSSLECNDGLTCRGLGPTERGVCAPPAAVGLPCGGSVDALAVQTRQETFDPQHSDCSGICELKRCNALAKKGEACATSKHCEAGLHCADKKCVDGAKVKGGEKCFDDACEAGFACIESTCVALKSAGEPCKNPFECKAACIKGEDEQAGKCGMRCSAWPPAGYPGGLERFKEAGAPKLKAPAPAKAPGR